VTDSIETASTPDDYAAFGALVGDYVAWLRARPRDRSGVVDEVLGHQDLAAELKVLPLAYGPPNGRAVLARRDGAVCGGGAFRRLSDEACEMKRLFVRERFRGAGMGRRLCEALIAAAGAGGFRVMRLDTLNLLDEAIALYRAAGFRDCAPYVDYPPWMLRHLVFMERPL